MTTIFTQIIAGIIPSHVVYEDTYTFAFLDNTPKAPGHVLIVPKIECDKFYDLEEPYYTAVFQTAKKIAKAVETVFGVRVIAKIIGTDVPHVHIHILPLRDKFDSADLPQTPHEFALIAAKIVSALK